VLELGFPPARTDCDVEPGRARGLDSGAPMRHTSIPNLESAGAANVLR
jgi:hypothetical protein